MLELTKTQRANILAGIANVEPRTVQKYLDGNEVQERKRESIELAERTWSPMTADYEEACARRKLERHAPVSPCEPQQKDTSNGDG